MNQEDRDTSANTFDLASLLYLLNKRASAWLRKRGCFKSSDCAGVVVDDYVFKRGMRRAGRCIIEGSSISVNFTNAKDPLLVLYRLLAFEVLAFQRACDECNRTDPLPDESGANPKRVPPSLCDPATPETLLEALELWELFEAAFTSDAHRKAFYDVVVEGRKYSAVAKELEISVSALRQWICRDKKKIRKVLMTCWQ